MIDQAASLRLLKKFVEANESPENSDPRIFLDKLPRPSNFCSILIISLDQVPKALPPMQQWLPAFFSPGKRVCLWDQSKLFSSPPYLRDSEVESFPTIQREETTQGPISTIPHLSKLPLLAEESMGRKLKFLRHFSQLLGSTTEFWITIPFSQMPSLQPIVHAADVISILTPNHPDAILRAYEAIKSLHLSGYFSKISLVIEQSENGEPILHFFERINSVAKKFLSLDLELAGVILSGNNINHSPQEGKLRALIESVNPQTRDFLHAFSERLLFPAPGEKGGEK